MASFGQFRVKLTPELASTPSQTPAITTVTSQERDNDGSNLGETQEPRRNGFEHDRTSGLYPISWDSFQHFEIWMTGHEAENCVEFTRRAVAKNNAPPGNQPWSQRMTYLCVRQKPSRQSHYEKKHPERKEKAFKKPLENGCSAKVVIKTYPGIQTVLGHYCLEHNHDTGGPNIKYTTLSKEILRSIENKVELGMRRKEIFDQLHAETLKDVQAGIFTVRNRDSLIKLRDIGRIECQKLKALVQLHSSDDVSILQHVERLRSEGEFVFLKSIRDQPPPNSNLDAKAFILIIQTRYQQQCWSMYGHDQLACIDATHNTTMYTGMSLFTVVTRDNWGHGMPIAYMLSSNGTQDTVSFFLRTLRSWDPMVLPSIWMTDRDHAEINSIELIYPKSVHYLCRWHVLHAWYQHLDMNKHDILWGLLKKLVYTETESEFNKLWSEIRAKALTVPHGQSFLDYMTTHWVNDKWLPRWATYFRTKRTIFEESDTNMLVESWHHLLKSFFGEGKRNRRVDHLIHILTTLAIKYFKARHQAQLAGLDGHNLEQAARLEIFIRASKIPKSTIMWDASNSCYTIPSQSAKKPDVWYTINPKTTPPWFGIHFPDTNIDLTIKDPSVDPVLHDRVGLDSAKLISSSDVSFIPPPTQPAKLNELSSFDIALSQQAAEQLKAIAEDLVANPRPLEEVRALQRGLPSTFTAPPPAFVLPPTREKIAPNQSYDWKSTSQAMGSTHPKAKKNPKSKSLELSSIGKAKTGPKRKNVDPYSGGERPGKKMKADITTNCPAPAPTSIAPTYATRTISNSAVTPPAMASLSSTMPSSSQLNPTSGNTLED